MMVDTTRSAKIIVASLVSAIFLVVTCVGVDRAVAGQKKVEDSSATAAYSVRLISPAAGDVLVPGSQVTVVWEPTISKDLDLTWCEQEIYLSLDGGKTAAQRISPQLDPRATSFVWTVPNTPSQSAVLDLRFGCEGTLPETLNPQTASAFVISKGPRLTPTVELKSLSNPEAAPGERVEIGWDSNVEDAVYYEVKVSYDQGAHFHRLGKTVRTEYTWKVPSDLAGHATFKVVAHTQSGALVESVTSAKPNLLVRSRIE